MAITRRNFLRVGTTAVLAAGLPLGVAGLAYGRQARAGKGGLVKSPLDPALAGQTGFAMRKATFAAHLNTTFLLQPEQSSELPVKLIEVADKGPATKRRQKLAQQGKECFAVIFEGRHAAALKQGTYHFQHDALGQFQLFVVPVQSKRGRHFYEAVINHIDS